MIWSTINAFYIWFYLKDCKLFGFISKLLGINQKLVRITNLSFQNFTMTRFMVEQIKLK